MKKLMAMILFLAAAGPPAEAASGHEACRAMQSILYSQSRVTVRCRYEHVNAPPLASGNVYGFTLVDGPSSMSVGEVWGGIIGGIVEMDNLVPTRTAGVLFIAGSSTFFIGMGDLRRCHRVHGVGSAAWVQCTISAMKH